MKNCRLVLGEQINIGPLMIKGFTAPETSSVEIKATTRRDLYLSCSQSLDRLLLDVSITVYKIE